MTDATFQPGARVRYRSDLREHPSTRQGCGTVAQVYVDLIRTGYVLVRWDNGDQFHVPETELEFGTLPTLDMGARYTVDGYRGVAFYLLGYATQTAWGFEEDEEIEDRGWVRAVMVGDDRELLIDVNDLTPLADDDYCHECGQVGCGHDGLDR